MPAIALAIMFAALTYLLVHQGDDMTERNPWLLIVAIAAWVCSGGLALLWAILAGMFP